MKRRRPAARVSAARRKAVRQLHEFLAEIRPSTDDIARALYSIARPGPIAVDERIFIGEILSRSWFVMHYDRVSRHPIAWDTWDKVMEVKKLVDEKSMPAEKAVLEVIDNGSITKETNKSIELILRQYRNLKSGAAPHPVQLRDQQSVLLKAASGVGKTTPPRARSRKSGGNK